MRIPKKILTGALFLSIAATALQPIGTFSITSEDNGLKTNSFATLSLFDTANAASIKIIGDESLVYGQNDTVTYTALSDGTKYERIEWSSSNTDVLEFKSPSLGEATVAGAGDTTVTATIKNDSGEGFITETLDVHVLDPSKPPEKEAGYTINYLDETIIIDENYQVSRSKDFDSLMDSGSSVAPGETIYVRFATNEEGTENNYTKNVLKSRPKAPIAPVLQFEEDAIKVVNKTKEQEYSLSLVNSDNEALTATQNVLDDNNEFDNIEPGKTYQVSTRVAATESEFASEYSFAEIKADENANKYEAVIEWGENMFEYDLSTMSWGSTFNGTNNSIKVTNNSSVPVTSTISMSVSDEYDELAALDFALTSNNLDTGNGGTAYPAEPVELAARDDASEEDETTAYINIKDSETIPDFTISNYTGDVTFGEVKIKVEKA